MISRTGIKGQICKQVAFHKSGSAIFESHASLDGIVRPTGVRLVGVQQFLTEARAGD
jgi:hypothetical protein